MISQLQNIGEEIWIYEGSTVRFYGFPFPTRMTVIRLRNSDLWIHSPVKINKDLKDGLYDIGEVKYLVSPNKLHHLFLPEWIKEYPKAATYAAPGLARKRKDIQFDVELSEVAEDEWAEDISQTIFTGSPALDEVVFFHKRSSTLILTDLIENLDQNTLNIWQKGLAKFAGIISPHGKTPIDWRITFLFGGKSKARDSLATMLEWNPDNIILSHGECIFGNGGEYLKSSFRWLQKNA